MGCGSSAATPMVVTPTICAPLGGGHMTQQTILGAFAPSNQQPNPTAKSYAQAAHGHKGKEPHKQAQQPPAQQPQPQSRKRADPQSDPMPTPNNNTSFASPPPEEEEEPEDTPFFIQLAQLAEDKKDIKSEDVATFMKFLLSRLEGLDATPDGMDKGRKGPWIFYVDDDAHNQFKAAYGDKLKTVLSGIPHEFGVTYGELADSAPRKSSAVWSSSLAKGARKRRESMG